MAKNTLYKITVLNWQKHNPNRKKSYKYTMIANNITSDPKLNSVPTSHRWLYIGIITTCGDHNNETITMTERQVNDLLTTREGAHNALSRLESLQLVTIEKIDLFINRIEENRKEKNRIEENIRVEQKKTKTALAPTARIKKEPEKLHTLICLWNEHCGKLAKVRRSNASRDRKCDVLFKNLSLEEWREVVLKIAASDFCCGKNDRGWVASFDFLLKPDTALKVLEGKYDNRANHTYGKTEDGRYLTNAVKRAYNNKIMIDKYLRNEGEIENENENIEPDLLDSGMS